ncbi:protein FAM228A isoform X1 [Sphaeramia orbicularis]|uniref:protein FAM228A isoform X1 n=1 Tax=Sphaeramia orbicularis TaxID=375764 RepID=UPI00117E2843|nr:protein FAM228B isoform X1 [Sphaeramia orbicularis]XP_029984425.1 protein FAM228B isoform X1 [Sphaeramia orbicularis]
MADPQVNRKLPCQPTVKARSTNKCGKAKVNDEAVHPRPQQRSKQERLSHTSLRRLQVQMEAEKQQARDIIQPLLDRENGFMKDLESFLKQRDVEELRRKELLHKRWTERVWLPLQKTVEERASSCSSKEIKRRQGFYSHYLHHCNTKGFVFLETYDPQEYNPFFISCRKSYNYKLSAAHLKDPSYLLLSEKQREKRMARSCEAGCKYSDRDDTELPLNINCLLTRSESVLQRHPEAQQRKPSRLDTIPYHIRATTTPDGRCHKTDCWFSTGGW